LLLQTIEEAATEVGEDLSLTPGDGAERRREAFQLVAYKLERLRVHVATTRRLLNDLRNLRLMLDGERVLIPIAAAGLPNARRFGARILEELMGKRIRWDPIRGFRGDFLECGRLGRAVHALQRRCPRWVC
jgi:hypothetical protein